MAIDFARRSVSVDGANVQLTAKEYKLLQMLARHAGNVVTHDHLLKEVWGPSHAQDGHYLRIFIRKIRRKIERASSESWTIRCTTSGSAWC